MDIKCLGSSSSGNSTRISDETTALLLDAGLPFRRIREALNFKVSDIAGALITHQHQDHCRGVPDLMAAGVDCWMPPETIKALGVGGHHRARIISPMAQFSVGTWQILPFPTLHDVENVGFLLMSAGGDRVLYLTDTPYCRFRFEELSHVLIEANYDLQTIKENVDSGLVNRQVKKRVLHSHLNLQTAKDFFLVNDRSRLKEVWLLHLSSDNSEADRFKREVQEIVGCPVYVAPEGGRS